MTTPFRIRYTDLARQDIRDITVWSRKHFGEAATGRYETLLKQGTKDLSNDPQRPGAQQRAAISPGVWTYHLRFSRDRAPTASGVVKHPRHMVVYRFSNGVINVLRILHDSRDLSRHVPHD